MHCIHYLMYILIPGIIQAKCSMTPPLSVRISHNQMLSLFRVSYLIPLCTNFLMVGAGVPSSLSLCRVNLLAKFMRLSMLVKSMLSWTETCIYTISTYNVLLVAIPASSSLYYVGIICTVDDALPKTSPQSFFLFCFIKEGHYPDGVLANYPENE
jgi:hypothetical protein